VWIDTERGTDVISYACSMAHLNMTEEEFCARRMEEHQCVVVFFLLRREMEREHDMEKREEQERKREKAHHAKRLSLRVVKKR
jgi:hypothetical protein